MWQAWFEYSGGSWLNPNLVDPWWWATSIACGLTIWFAAKKLEVVVARAQLRGRLPTTEGPVGKPIFTRTIYVQRPYPKDGMIPHEFGEDVVSVFPTEEGLCMLVRTHEATEEWPVVS